METIKYLTKEILREANAAAISENRNMGLNESFIEQLNELKLYPVISFFIILKEKLGLRLHLMKL